MNDNKKPFDSTVCFTFYGSWIRAIEQLETDVEKNSLAYRLFKAIAEYSLYDSEPNFDDLDQFKRIALKAVWETISTEIDVSIARRKRGFASEAPTDLQKAIIAECIKSPDDSCRAIADAVGASKSEVDRIRKKYAKHIAEGIQGIQTAYSVAVQENKEKVETEDDLPF